MSNVLHREEYTLSGNTGTEKTTSPMPSDSEMLDFLASLWNSQREGHHLMGRFFRNTTGSFRDAVASRMSFENNR